jgi:xanthine dehydrogenase YagR molybdenum-binding subunit
MTTYIGTATSRVDGLAKVTGAAKYASEFNTADLAHASVVTTPIAKGRITRIDASEALSVAGVIDVLTHRNRPRMASADSAYKDDTAPEGSPFRPLYDDRIWFSGQPVAVVVAEEPEVARFAASLVRVEYEEEAHVTDLYRQRDAAVALEPAENPFAPPKPRGRAERALTAAQVRHRGEYFVPIEHHNPMELYASTVIFEPDGKLTIYERRKACRMSSATYAACSRWRRARCASCRRLSAAPSVPGCARNIKGSWRRWRRAR